MYRFWTSAIRPLLDAVHAQSVVEIGVADGKQTQLLLPYLRERDGILHAIDPVAPDDLAAWKNTFGNVLDFYERRSLEVLPLLEQMDAVLIDGDHNWYTVFHELKLIETYADKTGMFPLVLLHDVGWPYGRRDQYCDPATIPETERHSYSRGALVPAEKTLGEHGFNDSFANANQEGGPRNGVLTAIEDFLQTTHHRLQLHILPGMFGLAVLFPSSLPLQNSAFDGVLRSLQRTDLLRMHIELLEQSRLATLHERAVGDATIRRQTEEAAELHHTVTRLQETINHITHTRSWRWTYPMRALGEVWKITRKRGPARGAIAFVRLVWNMCGQPFAGSARSFRYGVLGKAIPVEPPADGEGEWTPDDAKTGKQYCDVDVFVQSGDERELIRTLQSIARQRMQPRSVTLLCEALTEVPAECRTVIPDLHTLSIAAHAAPLDAVASEMKAAYVVCVRSGDILHPDFLRKGSEALEQNANAAIAAADCFVRSLNETRHASLDVSPVVRTVMVKRALERETMHDMPAIWHAMADGGAVVVTSDGLVFTHDDVQIKQTDSDANIVDVTLCLALSGRTWMWPHTRAFLERQTFPAKRIHLIVMDTSQNDAFADDVRAWVMQSGYGKTTFIRETVGEPGIADKPRDEAARAVTDACVKIYNSFASLTDTPTVFTLEDDVIPPDDAFVRLAEKLKPDVLSVSATYRHRLSPDIIAWDWINGTPVFASLKTGITKIGGNGFGCLAMQGAYFATTHFGGGAPLFNFDHNFYHHAVHIEGRTALIDWDCRCKHYVHADHWVVAC